jgi:amidohydrolase
MKRSLLGLIMMSSAAWCGELSDAIKVDYDKNLAPLFDHFHRNPELSFMEFNTSKRLAEELRAIGFTVTEKVGKTGVVAIYENGSGPLVMMRADMDALPVEEKSGLANASKVKSKDWDGNIVSVMHACGHDVHITSLVGTARQMMERKNEWRGTLMLVGQPAEERVGGAKSMMQDQIWQRFGKPDFALAMHVNSEIEAGKIYIDESSPYSGVDTLDILIHGIGTHGASPHRGKDPVVIGSQIVLAMQTIISREIAPRENALITVGSFHSGSKHNIISDQAKLQITVRSENRETRNYLIAAIERVAHNTARAAGLPEDKLPEVKITDEPTPPVINDAVLAKRLKSLLANKMGEDSLVDYKRLSMLAEDFGFFTTEPYIPSVYFQVGGTPAEDFIREKNGGSPVPSHHSPLFKISPKPAITKGVEATVLALMELMKR